MYKYFIFLLMSLFIYAPSSFAEEKRFYYSISNNMDDDYLAAYHKEYEKYFGDYLDKVEQLTRSIIYDGLRFDESNKLTRGNRQPAVKQRNYILPDYYIETFSDGKSHCKLVAEDVNLEFLLDSSNDWFDTKSESCGAREDGGLHCNYVVDNLEEAQLRNVCIGAQMDAAYACVTYHCDMLAGNDEPNWDKSIANIDFKGDVTIDELCNFANNKSIDCWNDTNEDITTFMKRIDNDRARRHFYPIDTTVENMLDGHFISELDMSVGYKQVCYGADSNGDTIWHAMTRSDKKYLYINITDWVKECYALVKDSETGIANLISAIFFTENNSGETAIAEAVRRGKVQDFKSVASILSSDDCNKLVEELITQPGVTREALAPLCPNK